MLGERMKHLKMDSVPLYLFFVFAHYYLTQLHDCLSVPVYRLIVLLLDFIVSILRRPSVVASMSGTSAFLQK